ncbi:hypothetical protein D3C86_1977000 [compost metagenome]
MLLKQLPAFVRVGCLLYLIHGLLHFLHVVPDLSGFLVKLLRVAGGLFGRLGGSGRRGLRDSGRHGGSQHGDESQCGQIADLHGQSPRGGTLDC